MASTSAVRRTDSALRAAVIRVAVTGGLTLLACVVGSAVAEAATSSDVPAASTTADTLQADMSDLVNSLFSGLGGQHHGGVSAIQPPADDNGGNANGAPAHSGRPTPSSSAGSGQGSTSGSASDSGSGDVWTGSTTVTVPAPPPPPAPQPPASPVTPPPTHVAPPTPPPASHVVDQHVAKPTGPSMGAPTGAVPDLPRNPNELPLQQPASQPVSTPSTGGTASHDLGGANGVAAVTPPGAGFRPRPGSTTEEPNAKRVSDGVPGLPSTSPD